MAGDFIRAFSSLNDHAAATEVLQSAREARLANTQVFNAFLGAHSGNGDASIVQDVLQQMRSDKVPRPRWRHAPRRSRFTGT